MTSFAAIIGEIPTELMYKVYSFDSTRRENYDKVVEEIELYREAAKYEELSTLYPAVLLGSSNWFWHFHFIESGRTIYCEKSF